MPDTTVAKLHDWLREHQEALVEDTRAILRFPSIEGVATVNAPYGQACRDALDFALGKADAWGMRTTDLEGHIGYAEFGSGERLIMSLGHLDVVPVGPGWKYGPFDAELVDGYIYARGSTDDKGPTMAAFYAMRAIQQVIPDIPARMRIAFGCDEESGFKCVERYMQTEESPTYGVAPDSGWPLYHAEKGIADFVISRDLPGGTFKLLHIEGGQRPNIVIDQCSARVEVAEAVRAEVAEKVAHAWDANVSANWTGNVLEVTAQGKAAHGAAPMLGDNAAVRILRFLFEIAPVASKEDYEQLLEMGQTSGAGIGILGRDELTELTCNLGIVTTCQATMSMLFNIRYPVTWNGEKLKAMCLKRLNSLKAKYALEIERDSPPLYFPLDHPLVKAICEVYTEETGETREPGVMGGGTYARAIPNTVSIGTCWEGDGAAHETNERIAVESLFRASRIYASLFYRLATM